MRRKHAFATLATALAVCALGAPASAGQYAIVDPVLAMPAWTLALPAGWTAQGTMLPGTSCSAATTPVYKATSPDGRSGAYFLPRVDWAWGAGVRHGSDCLPWSDAVSARDFLRYQVGVEQAAFIGEEPVPPASSLGYGATNDQARGLVRYTVGSHAFDAVIEATVVCQNGSAAGLGETHHCSGLVRKWFGPAGTVVPNVKTFESLRLSLNPDWMSRWTQAMRDSSNALSRQQTAALLRQGDLAQASRMRQHQAYMTSMQREADVRRGNFVLGQYRKQRNNDEFVDYVLDCSRVYSGDRTVRVSGANCPNRQTF